ncbi:hypothetical protein PsYK624_065860 [Phanerochaete sordida]|uniref:Uncharacterized protein n=1 Tax=Phanerochaete sordida TaxID=48140 RepID=A0A9P3G920_9APHY|nr:hypothetical protein PsYK624_065860 [Phanerochaete sordida]
MMTEDFMLPANSSAEAVTPLLVASLLQLLPNLSSLTLDRVLFPSEGDDSDGIPGDQAMHGLEQVSLTGMRTLLEDGLRDFHPLSALLGDLETFPIDDPPPFPLPFLPPLAPLPALLPPSPTHSHNLESTQPPALAPGWLRSFAQTRPLLSPWSSLRALDVACRTPADAAHVGAFLRLAGAQLLRLGCAVHGDLFRTTHASPCTISECETYDGIVRALALKESCPRLETLALRAAVRDLGGHVGALLGLAAALLARLPPALRRFALELDLGRDVARARVCVWDGAHGGWAVLRDALAGARVVHFDVCWRCAREGVGVAERCDGADVLDSVSGIMDCGAFTAASRWEVY